MPSDASIYSLLQTPKALPGPLDQFGQALQIKSLMGQQNLQGLQQKQLQNSINEEDAFKRLLGSNPDASDQELMSASPKLGLDYSSKRVTNQKNQMDLLTKATEVHRDQLANVNDPQSAAQWVMSGYKDPILAPLMMKSGTVEDAISRIPQDLQTFQQWKQQNALGATKFIEMNKPSIHMQDTGGASNIVSIPGLGGAPQVIGSAQKSVTPDALLHNQTTIRGQNMTDSRSREANGIMANGQMAADSERMAQAIAAGQLAPLSGWALNKPGGRAVMSRVMELNPSYNAQDFGAASKAVKDFSTGKNGNTVRSFNVGLAHLDTLSGLADALDNKNTQLVNKIGNAYAEQTGNPAPTNFNAAKQIVGDEIVKAIIGAGGGVADREKAQKVIDAANSPAQLKGAINTYKELMRGQLGGLQQQYEQTTGRKDFDKFLSQEGKSNAHAMQKKPAVSSQDIDAELRRRGVIK